MDAPAAIDSVSELTEALQSYFGFASFRPGQEEIARRAVAGRDTLALMPTGAGKSICYQLAAMLRPTPTLVISPLIALMKDQFDNLPPAVARQASLINSTLDPDEAARRLQNLATGQYKLLFAAPERLRQRQFVAALRSAGIGLVVIDEVHCVSMWGHDFRPDYLFLRSALELLGRPAVLGLTATATTATEQDIASSLDRPLEVVRTSVVRPNLRYEVMPVANEDARLRATLERAGSSTGPGIVYARSRENCEKIARLLSRNGVSAAHYHAGLEKEERARTQESFLRGSTRVIVATTAFGMGIDKQDVRWMVLYNFPDSLESYVQQVGRAGRDGQTSTCLLLTTTADISALKRFARKSIPSVERLRAVYRHIALSAQDGWAEVTVEHLAALPVLLEDDDPRVLIGMLERAGLVRRDLDVGRAMRIQLPAPPPDSAQRIERLLQRYEEQALGRAHRMVNFASSRRCRHQQVAAHFGETVEVPCGMCDICAPVRGAKPDLAEPERALPGDIARTMVETVRTLSWPLGVTGLAAMLKGAVDAPPSSQRHPAYGSLAAATPTAIKRWIGQLVEGGQLEPFESADGYKLLRPGQETDLPSFDASPAPLPSPKATDLDPASAALFEQLRSWRTARASSANIPPYAVLNDATLFGLVAARPTTNTQLLAVKGIGPAKAEQFGEELLALLSSAHS